MASQRGKMITCDRCGESIFLKELEVKEKDMDGGFTRWNEYKYEELPDGWANVLFDVGFGSNKVLCPECMSIFDKVRAEFWMEEKDDV